MKKKNLIIKASFDPSIVDPTDLKLFPKVMYDLNFVCDQLVIFFGCFLYNNATWWHDFIFRIGENIFPILWQYNIQFFK